MYKWSDSDCTELLGISGVTELNFLPEETAPRLFRTFPKNYRTVDLKWFKREEAQGYQIYRAASKNGKYTKIADIKDNTVCSYRDASLEPGITYYYKIRNVIKKENTYDYSPFSSPITAKTEVSTPNIKVTSKNYKNLGVSWSKAGGASGYVIYRSSTENGAYRAIKEISGNTTFSYVDIGRICGKTYYYKVRAYRTVSGERMYGKASMAESGCSVPATAVFTDVSASSYNTIKLAWKTVGGASGYTIYRSTSKNGAYKAIKMIKNGNTISYTDTGRSCGRTYYYKVRAYKLVDGKRIYGKPSSYKAGKATLAAPNVDMIRQSPTSIRLSWQGISGAGGYQIYAYDRAQGTYTKLKTLNSENTSFTVKNLSKGTKHYFKVRAYRTVNGDRVYGKFSSISKISL